MKRIIAAWIEQILEFDDMPEYITYIDDLEEKHQEFKETQHEETETGTVQIRIMKQYNRNKFPAEKNSIES